MKINIEWVKPQLGEEEEEDNYREPDYCNEKNPYNNKRILSQQSKDEPGSAT